jgi:hypothetical protein
MPQVGLADAETAVEVDAGLHLRDLLRRKSPPRSAVLRRG